jgi:hypothetical protein
MEKLSTIYSESNLSVKTYRCSEIYQYINFHKYIWLSHNTDDNKVSAEHSETVLTKWLYQSIWINN